MRIIKRYLYFVLAMLSFGLHAQSNYNSISGPGTFMQLNDAATDFEEVAITNNGQGYTFYHSFWDADSPWSVVSENDGKNIYTKLDLSKTTNVKALIMLTPELELSTNLSYSFSQNIFGISQDEVQPKAGVKFELKLLEGKVADFNPDSLSNTPSLSVDLFWNDNDKNIEVSNITPQQNGTHYFAICVTYLGIFPGNTNAVSFGFKRNTIKDNSTTGLNTVNANNIEVYPNPTSGTLNIEYVTGPIQVFDIMGKLVYNMPNYTGEPLNLNHLKKGIYLLGFKGEFIRFVKQ